MKIISKNIKQTHKLAKDTVLKILKTAPKKRAVVLGLYGELGSGKTAFTQGFAKALGVKKRITSPTFIIENIYKLPKKLLFDRLIHIDTYRLQNAQSLINLCWEEIINDPKNIILIEWADKIKSVLPKNHIKIKFEHIDKKTRKIVINARR